MIHIRNSIPQHTQRSTAAVMENKTMGAAVLRNENLFLTLVIMWQPVCVT